MRAVDDALNEVVGPTVLFDHLHELARQQRGGLLRLGMRGEDDRVTALECEHGVAHWRDDRIGHRRHRTDHTHRLGHIDQVQVEVLVDDPARLLILQVVPDDARLALVLEDLVFVDTDPGLLDRQLGEHLGIVVHVLADPLDDRIHLLLAEALELRLREARLGNEGLDLAVGGDHGFLNTLIHKIISAFDGAFENNPDTRSDQANASSRTAPRRLS